MDKVKIDFFELLTLVLVTGKVWGNLTWSWPMVFAPIMAQATFHILTGIGGMLMFNAAIKELDKEEKE